MAADGLVNRGNTLKEIGRVNDAIQDYIRAVTIRPTMAEGHANLASAYKDRLSLKLESIRLVICVSCFSTLFVCCGCPLHPYREWALSKKTMCANQIGHNEILLSESLWSSCQFMVLIYLRFFECVHIWLCSHSKGGKSKNYSRDGQGDLTLQMESLEATSP